jgi:hypothetical protein
LEGEDIIRMVARRRLKLDGCKEGEDIRMASRRGPKDGFKEKKTLGWLQGRRRHKDGCKEKT